MEAGRGGRLRRRLLRQHARGGARPSSRSRHIVADGHGYAAGGRRRVHPAAAPGRDASRRVQPALRRLGRGHAARTCSDLSDDLAAEPHGRRRLLQPARTAPGPQPVYNRDAAARDALRKVKAIFDPNGDHEPRQALLRGARRASASPERRPDDGPHRLPRRRDALHALQLLQVDPLRPREEPPLRQGLPQRRGRPVPLLLGRRPAHHRAQPDGRAQRGHRPGRRHRLQVPALRQLRRGLQAVPLRHGAARSRCASSARTSWSMDRVPESLPPADRAGAGGQSPARARRRPSARPGPRGSASRTRRAEPVDVVFYRRLQVLPGGEPAGDGAHAGRGCSSAAGLSVGLCPRPAAAAASPTTWATATSSPRPARGCSSSGRPPASRPSSRRAPTAATCSRALYPQLGARRRTAEVLHTRRAASTGSSRTGASSSPRPSP